MTLKVAVELLVFPALVLVKVTVCELYAVSKGTGLGGAELPDDDVVLHENVVVAVELEELFVVELDVEPDEEELFEEDEEVATEELEVLMAELEEEVVDDAPFPLRAMYAAAPPTAITTITIAAITAGATARFRLVIKSLYMGVTGRRYKPSPGARLFSRCGEKSDGFCARGSDSCRELL